MSTKLFVGSLSWSVDDESLKTTFEGPRYSCVGKSYTRSRIGNRESGMSRGYGFVEMESPEEAKSAIEALNDSEIEGRNIAVKEAKPRN